MSPPPPPPGPASARRRPRMRPGGRGDKARAPAGARCKREGTPRHPPATCGATSDGVEGATGGPSSLSPEGEDWVTQPRGEAGREVPSPRSPRLAEVGIVSRAVRCPGLGKEVAPPPQDPSPCLWSPWASDTKGIFGWVLRGPSGEEKGEHLEGRSSRGLGRLGGTSALSRARAPLGAGASGAGSAGALSSGALLEAKEEGPHPLQPGQLLRSLTSPLPGVSPIPGFLFLGKPGAGVEIPRGGGLWGKRAEGGDGSACQESLARSRLQLARASHPVCVRGHWADTASPGPGPPSPGVLARHLSTWAQAWR